MKKLIPILLICALLLVGCGSKAPTPDITATTLPVYEFTQALCQGTGLTVGRLITESVSCLHDYSLNVDQVKQAEGADTIVISGGGLEEFMEDILDDSKTIDASQGITLLEGDGHEHEEETHEEEGHHHEHDPHIWLAPQNAAAMARNICQGLSEKYPQYADQFRQNLGPLLEKIEALDTYGKEALSSLSCRKLITFHDGFAYFAQAFDLEILAAVEEESGSEASAKDLIELIRLVREHDLPAVFIEQNGSSAAAKIISAETGTKVFTLDMAMAGDSYFTAMTQNINAIKEAMG